MAHLETPDIQENDVTSPSYWKKNMAAVSDITPLLTSFEDLLPKSDYQETILDFVTPCPDELPVNLNACELMEAILKDLGIDVTPPATITPNLPTTPTPKSVPPTAESAICTVDIQTPRPVPSDSPELDRLHEPLSYNVAELQAAGQQRGKNRWCSSSKVGIRSTQQRIPGRRQTRRDCMVTKPQHVILKGAFCRTRWPSQFDIQEIATVTRLPQHTVRTWFKEERKMLKMRKRLFSDDVPSASTGPRTRRRTALSRTR